MWNSLLANARSLPLFDWKILLPGIDIGQFRTRYLNPAPGEASRLLCPDSAGCPEECHYRKVRELSSGLMACCPLDITLPRIPVTPEDIGFLSLNYARFPKEIADALGIEFSSVDLDDAFFWELGCLKTGTGNRMPVYISYYLNTMEFEHRLENLLREDRPFILLVGCLADIPKAMLTTLRQKKCVCLGLDDCVTIAPDGSFVADGETVNLLNGIRSTRQPMALTEYRCAPNTTWADVHIRKKDSDSVSIWVKGEAPVQINYLQLGLCNQVKGCPSQAFKALLALLSIQGKILPLPPRGTREYDSWKRRKLDLCAALRRFFPNINDGDPIEFVKGEGYRVRFVSRDDEFGSSNYQPSRI
mgnify:FL=1